MDFDGGHKKFRRHRHEEEEMDEAESASMKKMDAAVGTADEDGCPWDTIWDCCFYLHLHLQQHYQTHHRQTRERGK